MKGEKTSMLIVGVVFGLSMVGSSKLVTFMKVYHHSWFCVDCFFLQSGVSAIGFAQNRFQRCVRYSKVF